MSTTIGIFFVIFLISFELIAHTLSPLSFEDQLKQSDAVFVGEYLKKKSVRLENGSIATQMIFKVRQEYGLNAQELGIDEMIVHYPGGRLGQEIVTIDGKPEFIVGESVVIFLKAFAHRFWGAGGGTGAYRLISYGKEKFLINAFHPNDSLTGQINWNEFESKMRASKHGSMKIVHRFIEEDRDLNKTKSVENMSLLSFSEMDLLRSRSPASIENDLNLNLNEDKSQISSPIAPSISWLLLTLGILGGLSRIFKKKKRSS